MKKIITIATILVLATAASAFASSPQVFFSDFTDAPKTGFNGSASQGAAVTIWGSGFSSSRGSSTLTVGGVTLNTDADFPEWGRVDVVGGGQEPKDVYKSARGIQRICFYLNSSMATGATTIQITTSNGTSNTIPFYIRALGNNHVYFASPTGSDSANGLTTSTPFLTAGKVRRTLIAGDVAYFRGGIYSTLDSDAVSNGASALMYFSSNNNSGTANNSISLSSYPNEIAQFGVKAIKDVIRRTIDVQALNYWTFSKFLMRANEDNGGAIYHVSDTSTCDNLRFIGNDISGYNACSEGFALTGIITNMKLLGNQFSDNGVDKRGDTVTISTRSYPLYVEGFGHHDYLEIGWNEFAYNEKGRGFQIYGHVSGDYVDHLTIHDNYSHDNGYQGFVCGGTDGSAGWLRHVAIYNNILQNNGLRSDGYNDTNIAVTITCDTVTNATVYNNIFYKNHLGEVYITGSTPASFIFRNNIFYAYNTSTPYYVSGMTGSGVTASNNCYYNGTGLPSWDTSGRITSNPLFTAAGSDFTLQSGSPCRDAGYDVSSVVTKDYEGNIRPQGSGYDIGAYEYASGGTPADTTAPNPITNLSASTGGPGQIILTWTAPGDDGNTGTASSYIIRYATSPITTDTQFNAATDLIGEPAPTIAGSTQSATISGFTGKQTYYFAMVTLDKAANISALSNCANATTPNNSPVLNAIGNKSVNEGIGISFVISATDPDGDALTYSATGLPSGATFNASTRTFSWTPSFSQSGNFQVTFTASDGTLTDSETITISVGNVNRPPVLNAIGNKTVNEGALLQFTVSATDPDGTPVTITAAPLLSWMSFNGTTFTANPPYTTSGTYQVTFTASDSSLTDTETITITVVNINRAPVLATIGNKSVNAVSNLNFTVSATDADSDPLAYSASNLPQGASFDTSSKTFSWTPTNSQAGSYNVTFNVSDGTDTDSEIIAITVNNIVVTPIPDITITASATPISGITPLSVNFTASATSKNGSIVRYEWDFEGKGNYAWKSSQTGNTTYVYSGSDNYLATLRVTDLTGEQETYSILIQPQQNTNAPNVQATADRLSSTAPLKVYFKVNASSTVGIAKYEWDFEGNGIYSFESTRSGNLVKTYSKSGTYFATLRVTDFSGLSTVKEVTLNIPDNTLAPKVDLTVSSNSGTAPYAVTLSAINRGDNNLLRYEWDFNGDGVYDRSTYATTQVTYTYMRPGTFRPCVRVTNKNNLTSTASNLVTIKGSTSLTKPVASFTTTPSQGEVPLKVTLTNQSTGTIDSSIWDFNGDKTDDYALIGKPNVSYFYDEAGYYLVNLKVIGTNGLMDEVAKQIKVTALNSKPIVLIEPKDSQIVKGNISLAVLIDPRISPTQIKYQYQLQGTSTWLDIGTTTTYPYSFMWNTTIISDSTYLIRAVALNSNNQTFTSASITLIVNSQFLNPDTQGNVSATGEYVKQTKIDSSKLEEIYLFDGTQIEMPYQTVSANDTVSITIVDPDQLVNKINSNNSNITDINSYRDISLGSNTSLLDKEVTVIVPYDDKDNDGYVDGTTVKEETLDIYTLNETTGEWIKLFNCLVHPNENFVEGKTNHFSLFGLGGTQETTGGTGGSGGGGGGGCFIATAAFGTPMAGEVRALSKFRDNYLLTNYYGKKFVELYWHISPPIADYIRKREWAKKIVRVVLMPAVWMSQLL